MSKPDDISYPQQVYVCTCVGEKGQAVLHVDRSDGDWCFLCGSAHADDWDYLRMAEVGPLLDRDPTLLDVRDLPVDWQAERQAVGAPWRRTQCPPET